MLVQNHRRKFLHGFRLVRIIAGDFKYSAATRRNFDAVEANGKSCKLLVQCIAEIAVFQCKKICVVGCCDFSVLSHNFLPLSFRFLCGFADRHLGLLIDVYQAVKPVGKFLTVFGYLLVYESREAIGVDGFVNQIAVAFGA